MDLLRTEKRKKWKEFVDKLSLIETQNDLRSLFRTYMINDDGRINSNISRTLPDKFYQMMLIGREKLPDSSTFNEKMFWFMNDIYDYPICPTCNQHNKKHFFDYKNGYSTYCSYGCSANNMIVKNKKEDSNLKNHGGKWNLQNDVFIKESSDKKLKKYGSVNNIKKCQLTTFKNHGVFFNSQIEGMVDRKRKTCMDRYGVDCFFKTTEYRSYISNLQKTKPQGCINRHTMMKLYGVEYTMQIPEIHAKTQSHRWKEYVLPSGTIIKIQGYENKALDELLLKYNEEDIITSRKDMPSFWYILDQKHHRYYPDIYIPSENLIIEGKSNYNYSCDIEKNKAKFKRVRDLGFNFKLMVYTSTSLIAEVINES